MAVNILDIDPSNLKFDFERDWMVFRDGRIARFLSLWLSKQLRDLHLKLENASGDDVQKAQGAIAEIRKVQSLVERKFANEPLKEVLEYLEKTYGR